MRSDHPGEWLTNAAAPEVFSIYTGMCVELCAEEVSDYGMKLDRHDDNDRIAHCCFAPFLCDFRRAFWCYFRLAVFLISH
jgi:hypothetical protein